MAEQSIEVPGQRRLKERTGRSWTIYVCPDENCSNWGTCPYEMLPGDQPGAMGEECGYAGHGNAIPVVVGPAAALHGQGADQERQRLKEALEGLAAEFEKEAEHGFGAIRSDERVKRAWRKAAAHCRSLATLDPSGEQGET